METKELELPGLRMRNQAGDDFIPEMNPLHLKANLRDAYNRFWPAFVVFYGRIENVRERILYAKTHALIDGVIAAHAQGLLAPLIFSKYQEIVRRELHSLNEVKFITDSPKYFWQEIWKCQRFGIAETIVHSRAEGLREDRVKLASEIKELIRHSFKQN